MYKILKAETLAAKIHLMVVHAPRVASHCQPGQFIIVKMDEKGERIPLTICDYDREEGTVTIVFQEVGASTIRMSDLKAGDSFRDFVGPLGCPSEFVNEDIEELKKKKMVFIAGGVGTAPVYPQVKWLKEHGMPEITRVYKTTKDGKRLTLEDECLKSGTLPSIAYGFKRCSLKHKIGPQEKFCNNYPPCREVWRSGKKVVKFIGYDAGEHYRSDKVLLNDLADPKYSKWYPLMEWGWDREECIRQIEAAGLPQPGKSSCFFCPSMRAEEIIDLREHYPDLFRRALALEDNAKANLKTVRGLGRNYSWKERFGKEFI